MSRYDLSLPSHRAISWRYTLSAILCLCLGFAAPGFAVVCDSIASGNFNNSANWNCGIVPSIIDDATVQPGHNMISTTDVMVQSLTVEGTLTMQGFSLKIETPTLDVLLGGVLQGASGASGATVYVTSPSGTAMTVQNFGFIRGGSPGGSVFIHDGGGGGDLPCPAGSLIGSTGGFFQGGNDGGRIYLLAETVNLQGATVMGGSGFVPLNLFGTSQAGNVYIAGINVTIDGGSFITSGTNTNTAPGATGGSVKIVAQSCSANVGTLFVGAGSTVAVGGPSAGGCPGALLYAAGTSTILGTVAPGPGWCLYWDPPELELVGDVEMSGEQVILAGEELDASGLASRTLPTPAIDAADTLEININPGGTADFTGLTPGITYFRAGSSIIIRADQILTDPGVGLEELMEPAPEWTRGTPTILLDMTDDSEQFVSPGASVQYPVQVTNISSVAAYVEVVIDDSQGWLAGGPQAIAQVLEPGEAIHRNLIIEVPLKARRSRSTTVKLVASIDGQPAQVTYAVFILNG